MAGFGGILKGGKVMSHRQMGDFCVHQVQLDVHCVHCDIDFLKKMRYSRAAISKMKNVEIFKRVDLYLEEGH